MVTQSKREKASPKVLSNNYAILPFQRHALDVSYFDEAFTQEEARLTPVPDDFLESVEQKQFKGFSYTNPNYTVQAE